MTTPEGATDDASLTGATAEQIDAAVECRLDETAWTHDAKSAYRPPWRVEAARHARWLVPPSLRITPAPPAPEIREHLRAVFDDILSDDCMIHAERVEECIDSTLSAVRDYAAIAGPELSEGEREAIKELIHGTRMWLSEFRLGEDAPYVQNFKRAIAVGEAITSKGDAKGQE